MIREQEWEGGTWVVGEKEKEKRKNKEKKIRYVGGEGKKGMKKEKKREGEYPTATEKDRGIEWENKVF
jgi:hypothetical protein